MAKKRIFEGKGTMEKPGTNPVLSVVLALYVLMAFVALFSSFQKVQYISPIPLAIYLVFRGKNREKNVSVFLVKNYDSSFSFGYSTQKKPVTTEFRIEECSYWLQKEKKEMQSSYQLVCKLKDEEGKIIYLKEKVATAPENWERESEKIPRDEKIFIVSDLEKMITTMEKSVA